MADLNTWHIGRSFSSTHLEDGCPCPKAPCGLVPRDQAHPDCEHHGPNAVKTIRRSHRPDACPGPRSDEEWAKIYDEDETWLAQHADELFESLEQVALGEIFPARTVAETRREAAEDALWEYVDAEADKEDYPDFIAALSAYRDAVRHEAAEEIRRETQTLRDHEVLEPNGFRPCRDAACQIDPDCNVTYEGCDHHS